MKKLLAMTLACLSVSLIQCGGPAAPAVPTVPAVPTAAGNAKAFGEAQIGDRQACPISGEVFTVTGASPKAEYKGKTYYFCCPGCVEKFKADPEKYVPKGA